MGKETRFDSIHFIKSFVFSVLIRDQRIASHRSMKRGTKLGGVVVASAACLVGWYLLQPTQGIWSLSHLFRFGTRKSAAAKAAPSPRMTNLPNLYLWAWERPEDLKFLGERKAGVAFLVKTVYVRDRSEKQSPGGSDDVFTKARMQPLRVVPGTPLMAVVRIEILPGLPNSESGRQDFKEETLTEGTVSRIADEIVAASKITGVNALQIDFDATTSEHAFYKALLIEVRKRIPAEMPLSITALASWCIGDRWLEQLPPGTIDEAVPMLFRMGLGSVEVSRYIANGNGFTVSACATSLGVSTDEPLSRDVLNGKISVNRASNVLPRIYIFSPQAWDQAEAEDLFKKVANWHPN